MGHHPESCLSAEVRRQEVGYRIFYWVLFVARFTTQRAIDDLSLLLLFYSQLQLTFADGAS